MVKIGLLLATFGDKDILEKCLSPWINLRKKFDINIAICHGMFKEYHELGYTDNDIDGLKILSELDKNKDIDYLYIQNNYADSSDVIYQNEAELRNHGLKFLLERNIDFLWTIGADEFYTEEQIINIIKYIQQDNFIYWYCINYKNYVFNDNTYIKGFCPPRIWSNINRKIKEFYWDDDIMYMDNINYKSLPSKIIPEFIAFVKHYTWNNYEISKKKIEYQEKHFSHGAGCSFKANQEKRTIEWNEDFFNKTHQLKPEIFQDE